MLGRGWKCPTVYWACSVDNDTNNGHRFNSSRNEKTQQETLFVFDSKKLCSLVYISGITAVLSEHAFF